MRGGRGIVRDGGCVCGEGRCEDEAQHDDFEQSKDEVHNRRQLRTPAWLACKEMAVHSESEHKQKCIDNCNFKEAEIVTKRIDEL